jgi:hypothetical protein
LHTIHVVKKQLFDPKKKKTLVQRLESQCLAVDIKNKAIPSPGGKKKHWLTGEQVDENCFVLPVTQGQKERFKVARKGGEKMLAQSLSFFITVLVSSQTLKKLLRKSDKVIN